MKYLSENRIQDERGKVWFVVGFKLYHEWIDSQDRATLLTRQRFDYESVMLRIAEYSPQKNLLGENIKNNEVTWSEKWCQARQITIAKEPSERIVNIIF